jgi:membrane protease YdiL (CAAX protease family)
MNTTTSSTIASSNDVQAPPTTQPRIVTAFAYFGLLASISIYGFWRAFVPGDQMWLPWAQAGLLLALWLVTFVWKTVRPLRGYFLIALVMSFLPTLVSSLVVDSALGASLFSGTGFLTSESGALVWKLIVTLAVIGLLLAMGLKRRDFFLVKGQLDAPTERIKWLPGTKDGETWMRFGSFYAVIVFVLLLSGTLLANLSRLGVDNLVKALPLLPAALLFAAMNGVYEEVVFRAAPLSQLLNVVGRRHALLITIAYFGLGHFFGSVPAGIMGVALAAFFAYIMGKAMLETKGIVWPFICHFAADAAVFIFMAVAAVAAGTA